MSNGAGRPRRRTPWLLHSLIDVALAVALFIGGLRGGLAPDSLVLDAAAGYLLLVTFLTDAPGGLVKLLPRLAHRVVDGAVGAALLVSPGIVAVLHLPVHLLATLMAEAVGLVVLRGALVAEHRRRQEAPPLQVIDTSALLRDAGKVARRAGVATGRVHRVRRRARDGDGTSDS